jgi:hypothetical protein
MSKTKRARGLYDKQQLINAVCAVKSNKMTSVQASKFYKVPESTIRTHAKQPSMHIGAGRRFYLSLKQEGYLVELIRSFQLIGVRLTKPILKKLSGE